MHRRAGDYPLRTVPGGCILTAAVDVQADYLDLAVQSWAPWLETWVVDRLIIPGSPAQADTWKALDEYLERPFSRDGIEMRIKAVAVDTGYSSHDVYNFIRNRKGRHIIGIKGANRPNKPVIASKPTKVDVRFNGTVEPEGCELWTVGTDTCKQYWWDRWAITDGPGAIHFTKALGMAYFDGLMAEKRMVRQKGGRRVVEWVKPPGARNEPLDQANYNLACAYYLGLHRLNEVEWKQLEAQVCTVVPVAPAPVPTGTQRTVARPTQGMAPKNWLERRR
jgi:phage terminase large subunit GpA-like protein